MINFKATEPETLAEPLSAAAHFRLDVQHNGGQARALIRVALFKHDAALREAVDEDVQRLAKAAFAARGFADTADITRAGYSHDVALHFVERLTVGRMSSENRFAEGWREFEITEQGDAT